MFIHHENKSKNGIYVKCHLVVKFSCKMSTFLIKRIIIIVYVLANDLFHWLSVSKRFLLLQGKSCKGIIDRGFEKRSIDRFRQLKEVCHEKLAIFSFFIKTVLKLLISTFNHTKDLKMAFMVLQWF